VHGTFEIQIRNVHRLEALKSKTVMMRSVRAVPYGAVNGFSLVLCERLGTTTVSDEEGAVQFALHIKNIAP
jgi:hypothetical protein